MATHSELDRLALAQGVFFAVTGAWPIVHLESFEAVTGRKRDRWLVKTMGGVLAAIGAALVVSAFEREGRRGRVLLGAASASVLAASDVIYASRGVISRVYLADAAAEAAIVALWCAQERRQRIRASAPRSSGAGMDVASDARHDSDPKTKRSAAPHARVVRAAQRERRVRPGQ